MPIHRLHPPFRLAAALAAALALSACDRDITQANPPSQPSGPPSLVRARSTVAGVGAFGVADMNRRGDIVGTSNNSADWRAFQAWRWTRGGGQALLPTTGRGATAADINENGVTVGSVHVDNGYYFAATWDAGGTLHLLPLAPEVTSMLGNGINDAGVVVGQGWTEDGHARAFRIAPGGETEFLAYRGTRPPDDNNSATFYQELAVDVNAAGDALVMYTEGCDDVDYAPWGDCGETGVYRLYGALLWKASGQVVELQPLQAAVVGAHDLNDAGVSGGCHDGTAVLWSATGAQQAIAPGGCVWGVNEAGMAAGELYGGSTHGFRWTPSAGVDSLGTLGGAQSEVWDINEAGDVTGRAQMPGGAWHAFLWTPEAGMQDLPPVAGSVNSGGVSVNEVREVAGTSSSGSDERATRWFDVVVNQAPVADIGGPYPTRITGRRYVYSAAASTDADGEGARFSWDMNGDGANDVVTNARSIGYTHPAAGTFTMRLVMLDDGGRADTAATTVSVVANVAPVAEIGGAPASVGEGVPVALAAAVTDANQAADSTELGLMRYRWEWSDGYVSTARTSTHAFPDEGTYSVRLIVTDAGGLADSVVRAIAVGNVAPTARLTAPASLREGSAFTLTASALTDVPADVAAGLELGFNCGGGYGAWGTARSAACPARADQGSVTVGVRVRDKDGGSSETTRTITVGNVAPVVAATATSATTFAAGGTFSVRGTFTDPGAGDAPWRYRIYWGDGTYTALAPAAAGTPITGSHAYAAPGSYAVQIAVADKDGATGRSAPLTVTVTP